MEIKGVTVTVNPSILLPFANRLFPYFEDTNYTPQAAWCYYYEACTLNGDVVIIPDFKAAAELSTLIDGNNMWNSEDPAPSSSFIPSKVEQLTSRHLRMFAYRTGIVAWVESPYNTAPQYIDVPNIEDAVVVLIQRYGRSPTQAARFMQRHMRGILDTQEEPLLGALFLALTAQTGVSGTVKTFNRDSRNWEVFIDSNLVARYERAEAMHAHANFLRALGTTTVLSSLRPVDPVPEPEEFEAPEFAEYIEQDLGPESEPVLEQPESPKQE